MPVPPKETIREILYTRLSTLINSPDEDVALKAIKELGTIAGIYAEVAPKQLNATQTNNFVIPAEKLSSALDAIKKVGKAERAENERAERAEEVETVIVRSEP